MKRTLLILLSTILILGCSNKQTESVDYSGDVNYELEEDILTNTQDQRKVIVEAYINAEVKNLKAVTDSLKVLTEGFKGYYVSDELYKYDREIRSVIEIKVPGDKFNSYLEKLDVLLENIENKRIKSSDVTEEFIDINARLKSKREIEKRYLQLLDKAKNVTEIISIEQKLGEIREEIERQEGKLNYLTNRISFSTIHLTLSQHVKVKRSFYFIEKITEALSNGWFGFLTFLIALVYAWPFFIVIGVVIYFLIKRRKRKGKKNNPE